MNKETINQILKNQSTIIWALSEIINRENYDVEILKSLKERMAETAKLFIDKTNNELEQRIKKTLEETQ